MSCHILYLLLANSSITKPRNPFAIDYRKKNNNKKGKRTDMHEAYDRQIWLLDLYICTGLQNNNFKGGYQLDSTENKFRRLIIPRSKHSLKSSGCQSNSSMNLVLSKCTTCLTEEDKSTLHFYIFLFPIPF